MMEQFLENLVEECRGYIGEGNVATYIPELAKMDPNQLGICVISTTGKVYRAGEYMNPFTIQSVVKTIILLQALIDNGVDFVKERIGVEATGKPFDAINMRAGSLESQHINPMVNMGAIAMCSLIKGKTEKEKFERLLNLTRKLACNDKIEVNQDVYLSEKRTGHKNRALAYLLKSYGLIEGDVDEVLDTYFKACSISVNCEDLACIGYCFCSHGKLPRKEERVFESEYATYVNAILTTCGMYDGSGEFAINVGIPAKSGVGGGIMGVVPTRMGIGIFSPELDEKGNSLAGIRVLEKLSKEMYLSIF
ncbi:L-glutaminase [Lachnospiraceae bacterium XBB1006]|nr:L-glutaminase [Lachnospiraceae bacterium XBB1006]